MRNAKIVLLEVRTDNLYFSLIIFLFLLLFSCHKLIVTQFLLYTASCLRLMLAYNIRRQTQFSRCDFLELLKVDNKGATKT
jgi:hypothetical protein